jgi:chemotaxis signal transduction protein
MQRFKNSNWKKAMASLPGRTEEKKAQETAHSRVLVFRLGQSKFGLPLTVIHEVFGLSTPPIRVIGAPSWIWGLINHHGQVLTVIRMDLMLGVESTTLSNQVILVELADELVGLAVEQIESLEEVRTEGPQIQERQQFWCRGNLLEMIDLLHLHQNIQKSLDEFTKTR